MYGDKQPEVYRNYFTLSFYKNGDWIKALIAMDSGKWDWS